MQGNSSQPNKPRFIRDTTLGLVPKEDESTVSKERDDFYSDAENRVRILEREQRACFYCLRKLTSENFVIDHIVSRPNGDDSYSNVVASCRSCNSRKSNREATDYLRTLFRDNLLNPTEFEARIALLEQIKSGQLVPPNSL